MAVATSSLTPGDRDRLIQEPVALQAEPIPWRSPDLTPTNLATLLAARLGERTEADEAERILGDLGAMVNRSDDTLVCTGTRGCSLVTRCQAVLVNYWLDGPQDKPARCVSRFVTSRGSSAC